MFVPIVANKDIGNETARKDKPINRAKSELLGLQTVLIPSRTLSLRPRALALVLVLRQFV